MKTRKPDQGLPPGRQLRRRGPTVQTIPSRRAAIALLRRRIIAARKAA